MGERCGRRLRGRRRPAARELPRRDLTGRWPRRPARRPNLGLAALLLVAPSRRSPCHPRRDLLARWASGTEGRVCRSAVLLLSTGFGLIRVCLESCQGGAFRSTITRSRMPGRQPWMVGTLWVGGRARGSGAGRGHGHGVVMVPSGLRFCGGVVAATSVAFLAMFGCGQVISRGNSSPGSSRATTAVSMDVVSFLKASVWLLPAPFRAPGENPRFPKRAVAALRCRALLEDSALEPIGRGSPTVVWRR
jgi:hypothetical protein